jgi:hypothetical protein
MIYLKWKLSEGIEGTGPEQQIADFGGKVSGSPYVDSEGYRIFYLLEEMTTGTVNDLDSVWDVKEVTESEALAFCQNIWPDTKTNAEGFMTSDNPPEPENET